jgi:2-keto-4-pentenoate hydratase/2-oxohepta-3-ene-1,7-dioic acid hydratase in catechol pathway
MKIARFGKEDDFRYGIVDHLELLVLDGNPLCDAVSKTGERIPVVDAVLLAPVVSPSKVVCVGPNYAAPGHDPRFEDATDPIIFLKFNSSVIGPGETILIPPVNSRVVHEGGLAVVIGKTAKRVNAADHARYIYGYTIANDISARDLMFAEGQWGRAKGYDTFCPVGPVIETDLDPRNLLIETFVDGELRRRGSTSEMLHAIPELIAFISDVCTLLPGDLILTGTPRGMGGFADGQTVDIRVEGIGILSNPARNREAALSFQ